MSDNAAPLILLTRPRTQSERFAEAVEGLAEVAIVPLQEIVATGALPSLDGYCGLIFTSENAVRCFAAGSDRRDLPVWCVGTRTQATAEEAGFKAKTGGGTADTLIDAIVAAAARGPLLHLHGKHTRGDVPGRLTALGITTNGAEIYDQRAISPDAPISLSTAGRRVFAPLFSPRSAALLAQQIGPRPRDWTFLCLSEAVRAELPPGLQDQAYVAEETSANAMVCLLKRHIPPSSGAA